MDESPKLHSHSCVPQHTTCRTRENCHARENCHISNARSDCHSGQRIHQPKLTPTESLVLTRPQPQWLDPTETLLTLTRLPEHTGTHRLTVAVGVGRHRPRLGADAPLRRVVTVVDAARRHAAAPLALFRRRPPTLTHAGSTGRSQSAGGVTRPPRTRAARHTTSRPQNHAGHSAERHQTRSGASRQSPAESSRQVHAPFRPAQRDRRPRGGVVEPAGHGVAVCRCRCRLYRGRLRSSMGRRVGAVGVGAGPPHALAARRRRRRRSMSTGEPASRRRR